MKLNNKKTGILAKPDGTNIQDLTPYVDDFLCDSTCVVKAVIDSGNSGLANLELVDAFSSISINNPPQQ